MLSRRGCVLTTTPHAIRQTVETRVGSTSLTDPTTPLVLSLYPHLMFRDPARSPSHMEYAVGVSVSENVGDRSKSGGTARARTTLQVIVAYQLPAHDPDIDPALAVADDIRRWVNGPQDATYPATFQIMWRRTDVSALGPPGWIAVESTFEALHYLAM